MKKRILLFGAFTARKHTIRLNAPYLLCLDSIVDAMVLRVSKVQGHSSGLPLVSLRQIHPLRARPMRDNDELYDYDQIADTSGGSPQRRQCF